MEPSAEMKKAWDSAFDAQTFATHVGYFISEVAPMWFSFKCGDGEVRISMTDGRVELKNCAVDAAAQSFWDAVQRCYPLHRASNSSISA